VQAAAAGTAGLAALLVALLLAPRTSVPASASGAAAPTEASPENQERAAAPAVTMAPEPAAVAAAVDAEPLRAAAELCTDFARLVDSHELPALLERAAGLLDASGLIIWVADPPRQRLQPLLTHGYPASALARLPVIPREADNATAAAYRGGRVEVVFSNASSPGAIVVPILTGDGCVGVMAAEVRHGRETSETLPALARIVAAQLAAVVAIAPAQDERTGAERVANAE
jgi:GAF domain-containing protein